MLAFQEVEAELGVLLRFSLGVKDRVGVRWRDMEDVPDFVLGWLVEALAELALQTKENWQKRHGKSVFVEDRVGDKSPKPAEAREYPRSILGVSTRG